MTRKHGITLRTRLFLVVSSVSCFLLILFFLFTLFLIEREIHDRLEFQLAHSLSQTAFLLKEMGRQVEEAALAIKEDEALKTALLLGLYRNYRKYADKLQTKHGMSLVAYVDARAFALDPHSTFFLFNQGLEHPFFIRSQLGVVASGYTEIPLRQLLLLTPEVAKKHQGEELDRPLLARLVVTPVLDDSQVVLGMLVVGKIINKEMELLQKVKLFTGADCAVMHQGQLIAGSLMQPLGGWPYLSGLLPSDQGRAAFPDGGQVFHYRKLPLKDFQDTTVGSALVLVDEAPFRGLRRNLFSNSLLVLGAGLVASLMVSMAFSRRIVRPIKELGDFTRKISQGVWDQEIPLTSRDEIGDLTRDFNAMARELVQNQRALQEAHQKLLLTAHTSGMAELAASVLHNIGNVVNSINTRLYHLDKNLRANDLESLERMALFLRQDEGLKKGEAAKVERRAKMLDFLDISLQVAKENQRVCQSDLEFIKRGLDHTMEIIALQNKYAGVGGLETRVNPNELLHDAAEMLDDSIKKRGIALEFDLGEVPELYLDRNRMVQIFINLLKNACESLDALPPPGAKKISVGTFLDQDDRMVGIRVSDNGGGIKPEDLAKVFRFGFSTKGRGKGFGLHDAANYVKAHGGIIEIESRGIGQGATLTIKLPLPQGERR